MKGRWTRSGTFACPGGRIFRLTTAAGAVRRYATAAPIERATARPIGWCWPGSGRWSPFWRPLTGSWHGGIRCAWPSTDPAPRASPPWPGRWRTSMAARWSTWTTFFSGPTSAPPSGWRSRGATWTTSALMPRSSPPCAGTRPPAIGPGGAAPATWGRRLSFPPPPWRCSRAAIPSAPTCGSAITCASGPRPHGTPAWSASPSGAPAAPTASGRSGSPWRTAISPPAR